MLKYIFSIESVELSLIEIFLQLELEEQFFLIKLIQNLMHLFWNGPSWWNIVLGAYICIVFLKYKRSLIDFFISKWKRKGYLKNFNNYVLLCCWCRQPQEKMSVISPKCWKTSSSPNATSRSTPVWGSCQSRPC